LDLPSQLINAAPDEGAEELRFDEIAYAVSTRRLEQSWKDFKEQMDWSEEFIAITPGEDEPSSSAEFIDYGSISSARLRDKLTPSVEAETGLDLLLLGEELFFRRSPRTRAGFVRCVASGQELSR
jgi:hypothetical protein